MCGVRNIMRKFFQFVLVVFLFINFNNFANGQNVMKEYSGEKIQVDFYKMDLVNILPILDALSDKRYIMDNNVGCKVTMKLEAPWDYILDMILEKCSLKMATSGNLVLISNQ